MTTFKIMTNISGSRAVWMLKSGLDDVVVDSLTAVSSAMIESAQR